MVRMLFGIEDELLTAPSQADGPASRVDPISRFLRTMAGLTASLPCQQGFFHAGGKVYLDYGGHLEIATIECDDPFALVEVLELHGLLVGRALELLREPGLFLANNNHSGLLSPRAPTFGTHENYLIEGSPRALQGALLPFLATRVFQGAGGVLYPTGDFLLSVRALFLQADVGGDTTECRALFSTCRQESLMGRSTGAQRLHLICADGHRSQFNWVLLVGVTALVLQAVQWSDAVVRDVAALSVRRGRENWVGVLRRVNRLAGPDGEPRVDPMVPRVQRVYLEHVRRWMATQAELPDWAEPVVAAWDTCLTAFEENDVAWLSRRLDAFIKFELVRRTRDTRGSSWTDLPSDQELFQRLTLLDQSYHAIADPFSAFDELDAHGMLSQRVIPPLGERLADDLELSRWSPRVSTRARARARFIQEHAGQRDLLVDWAWVQDSRRSRRRYLAEPFAEDFGEWVSLRPPEPPPDLLRRLTELRRRHRDEVPPPEGGEPGAALPDDPGPGAAARRLLRALEAGQALDETPF